MRHSPIDFGDFYAGNSPPAPRPPLGLRIRWALFGIPGRYETFPEWKARRDRNKLRVQLLTTTVGVALVLALWCSLVWP